jgi:transcriptional regulator with XRE-family HTH domain
MVRRVNGRAIRDFRDAIGMSQTELASRSGVTASMLSKVERGANGMSMEKTRLVAEVLGVDVKSITYPVPAAVA